MIERPPMRVALHASHELTAVTAGGGDGGQLLANHGAS